jgi:serine/threonine protein kinase
VGGDNRDMDPTLPTSGASAGRRPAESLDTATGDAPPFRSPLTTATHAPGVQPFAPPAPGQRLDDFEILRELGAGSFATVFLARQISLDRHVALKVSANRGSEARTLASLEHDHIVQVFSEVVLPDRDLRVLCMQYVPGLTLARVIRALRQRDPRRWSGRAILEILDALSTEPAALDPAALHDRELLDGCDFWQAVCWIGARLAEALAYAHRQGVLHRDIKPANILVNRYGRPLLADFNIALDAHQLSGPGGAMFGGTLGYMSPEHLDAFNPADPTPAAAVDERADVYALGVVLFELLTGRLPFGQEVRGLEIAEAVRGLAAERRSGVPWLRPERPEAPEVLERVVRRCLEADPRDRYQMATELAQALEGCRELRRIDKELPAGGVLTRFSVRHPFWALSVLTLLPHVLGSAVNITYNTLWIVDGLTPAQQACFGRLVLGYNAVIYTGCLWLLYRLIAPVFRGWRRLLNAGPMTAAEATALRRHALTLPLWAVVLSCAGWLPGGILFPLGLSVLSEPVSVRESAHFLVSFTISGLIALTYSYFAVQFVVLRVLYPRMWTDAQGLRQHTRTELASLDRRLRLFQFLAGLIPLAGAVLLVSVAPEQFTLTFRLLVTALIALGTAGFGLALVASSRLTQTLTALVGPNQPPARPR